MVPLLIFVLKPEASCIFVADGCESSAYHLPPSLSVPSSLLLRRSGQDSVSSDQSRHGTSYHVGPKALLELCAALCFAVMWIRIPIRIKTNADPTGAKNVITRFTLLGTLRMQKIANFFIHLHNKTLFNLSSRPQCASVADIRVDG